MRRIPYNRAMNLKTYPFGIFDYPDLFIMVITGMAVLMFLDDYLILGVVEILYVGYVVSLRVGKPLGYDRHFMKSKFLPGFMRPGQIPWRDDFFDENLLKKSAKKDKTHA